MTIRRFRLLCGSAIIALTSLFSATTLAHNSSDECCWHNTAAIYGWIFGQHGEMLVKWNDVSIDVTPGDVARNPNLIDFILQMHFETAKDRWAFMFDPTFLKSTSTSELNIRGPINPEVQTSIRFSLIDFAAFYTIAERCWNCGRWGKFEIYGGGRNLTMNTCVTINPVDKTAVADSANWWAGMFGFRATFHVADRVNIWFRADAAGGPRTHSFNGMAMISYCFNEHFFVAGGFRALDFYGRIGGNDIDRFEMEVLYYGPMAGLAVTW